MVRRARAQNIEIGRGDQQRILRAFARVEQRIEQTLAHAERGDHDLARLDRARSGAPAPAPRRPAAGGARRSPLRSSTGSRDRRDEPAARTRAPLAAEMPVTVHDVQRIAGLPHVQPRQRAPGAADGIERAPSPSRSDSRDRRSASATSFSAFLSDLLVMSCKARPPSGSVRPWRTREPDARRSVRANRRRDRRRCRPACGCRTRRRARVSCASRLPEMTSILAPQIRSALAMKARPLLGVAAGGGGDRPQLCSTRMDVAERAEAHERGQRLLDRVLRPAARWSAPRGRGRRAPSR